MKATALLLIGCLLAPSLCALNITTEAKDRSENSPFDAAAPSPRFLKNSAINLSVSVQALAAKFKLESKGKKWGRSPGHKAVYQSIFNYRNELQTISDMCQTAAVPERVLVSVIDCQNLAKHMQQQARFIIIPQPLLDEINQMAAQAAELPPLLRLYEQRYLAWQLNQTRQRDAETLAQLTAQLSELQQSHEPSSSTGNSSRHSHLRIHHPQHNTSRCPPGAGVPSPPHRPCPPVILPPGQPNKPIPPEPPQPPVFRRRPMR